jgi:hypothetical protein
VLRALLRRTEPAPQLIATSGAPNPVPRVEPLTGSTDQAPNPVPASRPNNRRRKPIRILDIYREPSGTVPAARLHAAALFDLMKELSDDHSGQYVPKLQLQRMYADECRRRNWLACHWTAIGRELGRLTDKRKVRRHGRRIMVYRVPNMG